MFTIYLHHAPFLCVLDTLLALTIVQQLEAQHGFRSVALLRS